MSEFSVYLNELCLKVSFTENGTVKVDDEAYAYEVIRLNETDFLLNINDRIHLLHLNENSTGSYQLMSDGLSFNVKVRTALEEKAEALIGKMSVKAAQTEIKAPMPGMVLKINKSETENVNQGESLMILEAMKMENDLRSPASGKVSRVFIKEGEPVEKGALLFIIE
jgi:biotin carboxyl carrier protein